RPPSMSKSRMELLERLLADWPAKVLSLAGALALSYFYQVNKLEERPMSVPLVVVTNDDFVPASQYPRTVRLVLRGESNAIYAVLEGDIEATLDLRGYTGAGVWRVPVRVEKRGSALGIDPLEISVDPSDVALSIEPRVVKEVPVVPSFRGYLEPGFELAGFRLTPARMEIAGPSSAMEKLADAATDPIELTGRSDNFELRTKVQLRDPLLVLLSSNLVDFSAEVKKALVYRNFQGLELSYVGLRDGLALLEFGTMGAARVAASSVELEAFATGPGLLEADLSNIEKPGVYTVAVSPRFPAGFDVETWSPMVQTVTVVDSDDAPEVLP
ncbi:MAG TPA: CdaR family protein, partial [Spirochaetales bacterium]|nr:CdaR family protein [Spirochaetales bacterium]